jgi:hypothetical protein
VRARSLKPGFFKNDQLGGLQPLARILFAGLWGLSDSEGRLEDRPLRIKAEVLPFDNCSVESMLGDLAAARLIVRYVAGGRKLIWIPTFLEHQHPHFKEPKSILPAPEKGSLNTPTALEIAPLNTTKVTASELFNSTSPGTITVEPGKVSVEPGGLLTPDSGLLTPDSCDSVTERAPKVDDLIRLWNENRGPLPEAVRTKGRTTHGTARLRDGLTLERWGQGVKRCARSDFLTGKGPRGWRATIDWLLKPDRLERVESGEFDGGSTVKATAMKAEVAVGAGPEHDGLWPEQTAAVKPDPDKVKVIEELYAMGFSSEQVKAKIAEWESRPRGAVAP